MKVSRSGRVDIEELRKRDWPAPPYWVDPEIRNEALRPKYANLPKPDNYEEGARVTEGQVTAYALERPGRPGYIPAEECAITSLAMGANGKVYGATFGRRSHLFVCDTREADNPIRSLAILGEQCGVTNALLTASDGAIIGGTRGQSGKVFRFDPTSTRGEIETLTIPRLGEGIACLVIDRRSDTVYGITVPSGIFFALDLSTGETQFEEQIDDAGIFSQALAVAGDGSVWGAGRWGRLFRYRRGGGRLEHLDIKVPCVPGREMYTAVDAFAIPDEGGCIYGGEHADGFLFKLEPEAMRITCLGKPAPHTHIRCLTVGKDGRVYGISGRKGGMCHLFRHDPTTGESKTLGVLFTMVPRHWHGYEFDSILAGNEGEIYLGESDRISHLFVYKPS